MRLLTYNRNDKITIEHFDEEEVPRYAILSHTWGATDEEVTFVNIINGDGLDKAGYAKIHFCGLQARYDGLQYFWVDSCCIDTANKAEHSHAIRSMFRWYQAAAKCYVYLSDVQIRKWNSEGIINESVWRPAFECSRWFTRGWTLQELLAPHVVEFFSEEGEKLGDKSSLKPAIHKVTNIPIEVLEGAPLSRCSVNERLRWADGRVTQRDEDRAYSLQGIFDIELAPVYGEGAAGAFERLRSEIHKLEKCIQDMYCTDPRKDKERIEQAKGGLFVDSYRWVLNNEIFQLWQEDLGSRLLWVKGDAGKGKTMLLCGVINELHKAADNAAIISYFFCQATDSRINSATAVLRGLLYMLVEQQPALVSHVRKQHDRAGESMFNDANAWVTLTEIFKTVLREPSLRTTYFIIDALDECVTDLLKLLDFVATQSSASSRVKWIVSSRNWPDIETRLAGHDVKLSLELNTESVAAAVQTFIRQKVDHLAHEKHYKAEIRHAVLDHLMSNANDTFLWAALVCQDLEATANRHVLRKLSSFPPGLDALYARMIRQIRESDDAEICRQVLASTAILYRPVAIYELVALVEELKEFTNDLGTVREIIGFCRSFLTLRADTVYFVHQSAQDFLFAKVNDEIFPRGTKDAHRAMSRASLAVMSSTLRRDMYSLHALDFPIDSVNTPAPDPLATSRYPFIHWIDHLYDSGNGTLTDSVSDEHVREEVNEFLREKYLYWLEGLSLCKSVDKGILSLRKLCSLVQELSNKDSLAPLVQDAGRFIMYHKGAIESFPLQTYASALLFSPTGSLIRRLFKYEEPRNIIIRPSLSDSWNACLQTLEGHSDSVNSVAFSRDSNRLASASWDNTVKIWDASSGTCLQTLESHSDIVISVVFSRDSNKLASTSWNNTVKIWDASSGACLQTLEGHIGRVWSVAFSSDSMRLASASDDRTVKIWDANSGACLQTLQGHGDTVCSVAFSGDSARLASASYDSTIKIWDPSSGACLQTLEGHSGAASSVAFSGDSSRLASASYDNTTKIWDASNGACLRTLEGHSNAVNSVAFSGDSSRLASASDDSTIKIWDASSGICLQTLEGHGSTVYSVAFSGDSARLASASWDNTVKIWDASSDARLQALEGHSDWVRSVAFSSDSMRLASASDDRTVKIWDASSGTCLQTLEGHSGKVTLVAFSGDSTRLASASDDNTIKIWDARSGACLQTLESHSDIVISVVFSRDSNKLASTSWDNTVKIWDASSGACLQTLEGHIGRVWSVAFSSDSTRLALASKDSTIKIWDASSGACLQTFEGHSSAVNSVAFSGDSARLASASWDNTIKIWDVSSGACLQTREGYNAAMNLVADLESLLESLDSEKEVMETRHSRNTVTTSLDGIWISSNAQNLLWLPTEYRPTCSAILSSCIGLGTGSGKIWICQLGIE